MFKNFKLIKIIILIQSLIYSPAIGNINIIALVDNEVITNYDIEKEERYLKVLNPNLNNLANKELTILAKESLIKEIIKKKEISKLINLELEKDNVFVNDYLENLLVRLKYSDKEAFSKSLSENETYTLEELKFKIKIELFWNDLIYNKYNSQVIINEKEISERVNKIQKSERKEFFLSEIVFKKKKDEQIDFTISKIKKSIEEIGFDNTANIFSISESSKFGGKIGWVKDDTLSKKIYEKIMDLKVDEYSDVINLNDNFIILKINEIKISKKQIDKDKEIQKIIQSERNNKLMKLSRIYFNKIRKQYLIDEK